MTLFQSIILGIIEGITEFLPISSTGHLILSSHLLNLTQTDFVKTFEIAIQLGAIFSVVVLYWRKLLVETEIIKKIIAAFIPTAILGFIFFAFIKKLFESNQVVLWALLIGGIAIIVFEYLHKEKETAVENLSAITYKQAIIIGLFQSIAMIPGVSRAAATILGGLAVGLKRRTIVEFSFLLAVPTMLGATVLDIYKSSGSFGSSQFLILGVGFIVSFVVAIMAIKFLLNFIKNHSFVPFGVYRILVALAFWLIIL